VVKGESPDRHEVDSSADCAEAFLFYLGSQKEQPSGSRGDLENHQGRERKRDPRGNITDDKAKVASEEESTM